MPSNLPTLKLLLCAITMSSTAVSAEPQPLGTHIARDAAMANSLSVFPDGRGLPSGSGNPTLGKVIYEQQCRACHGQNGKDGINDPLVGGAGTLATRTPKKTVGSFWPYATTLFDYIQRAMPYNAPGTLSADELYSVTAYVLTLNEIISDQTTLDDRSLPEVEMPNRNGFEFNP